MKVEALNRFEDADTRSSGHRVKRGRNDGMMLWRLKTKRWDGVEARVLFVGEPRGVRGM